MNTKTTNSSTATARPLTQVAQQLRACRAATAPNGGGDNWMSFPELERTFAAIADLGVPCTVLSVRVANSADLGAASADTTRSVGAQLLLVFGLEARIAPVCDGGYAVVLPGIDQLPELEPRLEHALTRAAAGGWNGDGHTLDCRVGVARYQLEGSSLEEMVSGGLAAADEMTDAGHAFVSHRHLRAGALAA